MYVSRDGLVIRNAEPEDAPLLGNWWRDGGVMAHAGFPRGLDITDGEIARSLENDRDEVRRRLIIEINGAPAGEASFNNLGEGVAEIGIKICDAGLQEKGHGTRLLRMLIGSLFNEWGYEKVVLDTNVNNLRAQHVYEKLGFTKLRVNVDAWLDQLGQPQSFIDYEITKEAFIRTRPPEID